MTKETQLINQDTTTTIGNNIGETITLMLNSLNHAQPGDNKVDINIKGHYTHQDMLEADDSNVSNPLHHNTIGGNQGTKIPSHIHPSPPHLDVVLRDLHTLRDIEGARNHFLKLVEVETDQHVIILNGNYAYLYYSRYNLTCSTYFHTC
jgi:hypothetical protein